MRRRLVLAAAFAAGACVLGTGAEAQASSHREAPFVTENPKVDSTDFYMFRSYESGRSDYVTIIANYLPLQDAYGGPNYFTLDPQARYDINIDNNADGVPDLSFQFQFQNTLVAAANTLPITLEGVTKNNSVSLINLGGISAVDNSKLGVVETYNLNVVRGAAAPVAVGGTFNKPVDNIGTTSIANYAAYSAANIHTTTLPGCAGGLPAGQIKVFVGQRAEGFAANIGVVFDLIQGGGIAGVITNGSTEAGRGRQANADDTGLLYGKNVTSIALEIPRTCLTSATSTIIGGWTTANLHQARVLNPNASYTVPAKEGGAFTQVSRLGMPLVNEVVVGIKDKDLYGSLAVKDTGKIADYVTHPTLPAIIEILYGGAGAIAPKKIRTDLVATFAQGLVVTPTVGAAIPFTQNTTTGVFEYLRLNVADGFGAPPSKALQVGNVGINGLGVLGCFTADRHVDITAANLVANGGPCDLQGFPNGRRPGDDVVDITLRVAMGALFANDVDAPARNVPFTDANFNGAEQFDDTFPYLKNPFPGNGPYAKN